MIAWIILVGLDMGVDDDTIANEAGVDKSNIAYVKRLIELSDVRRRDIDSPNIEFIN